MPTYKVATLGTDIIYTQLGLVYTFPGDGTQVQCSEILNPLPGSLIETSQFPKYQPIIASWSQAGTATNTYTFSLPTNIVTRYQVNLWLVSGAWSVTFNGNGGQPVLLGNQNQVWGRTYTGRTVDTIQALCTSSGTLIIMVEQL